MIRPDPHLCAMRDSVCRVLAEHYPEGIRHRVLAIGIGVRRAVPHHSGISGFLPAFGLGRGCDVAAALVEVLNELRICGLVESFGITSGTHYRLREAPMWSAVMLPEPR